MPARKNEQASEEVKALRVLAESTLQRGSYSNLVIINQTPEEFILDFLMQFGGDAQLVSRIILNPEHADRLAKALAVNIEKRADANKAKVAAVPKKGKGPSQKTKFRKTAKSRGKDRTSRGGAA